MERILNKQKKLKEAFEKYTESINKTNERRQLWKSETKGKIYDVLKLIEKNFKFDWHVQRLEDIENYETINISCNSKSSGLKETVRELGTENIKSSKVFVKYGGYLAFSQSYNGKINVFMKFPYIEEWVQEMNVEVFDTIEPVQITEELISDFVIKFLDKLSKWEGVDREPLGCKNK